MESTASGINSLVRRQIEQLQQAANLPPHLAGAPLRPRLQRARTNLELVWASLDRRPKEKDDATFSGKPSARAAGSVTGTLVDKSRSVTHLACADEPGTLTPKRHVSSKLSKAGENKPMKISKMSIQEISLQARANDLKNDERSSFLHGSQNGELSSAKRQPLKTIQSPIRANVEAKPSLPVKKGESLSKTACRDRMTGSQSGRKIIAVSIDFENDCCTGDSNKNRKPSTDDTGRKQRSLDMNDAVYQTIDGDSSQYYESPVSPPTPAYNKSNLHATLPRKRKADVEVVHEDERLLNLKNALALETYDSPCKTACQPPPRELLPPKPSLGRQERRHPKSQSMTLGMTTEINRAASRTDDTSARHTDKPDPVLEGSTLTLPGKKARTGQMLWRRFSSFNPCTRWDDWSSVTSAKVFTKKSCDVKRAATVPSVASKGGLPDQRPPVPNRPLPPTPRPASDKAAAGESGRNSSIAVGLEHHPWYHNVDRKRAEELIKNGIDGYFLIRPSSQSQNPLTLTLWFNQRVYNISVRQRRDGRIALGFEKPDEQSFATLEELVSNYQSENLLLFSRNERTGRTVLTTSPPKH